MGHTLTCAPGQARARVDFVDTGTEYSRSVHA